MSNYLTITACRMQVTRGWPNLIGGYTTIAFDYKAGGGSMTCEIDNVVDFIWLCGIGCKFVVSEPGVHQVRPSLYNLYMYI